MGVEDLKKNFSIHLRLTRFALLSAKRHRSSPAAFARENVRVSGRPRRADRQTDERGIERASDPEDGSIPMAMSFPPSRALHAGIRGRYAHSDV